MGMSSSDPVVSLLVIASLLESVMICTWGYAILMRRFISGVQWFQASVEDLAHLIFDSYLTAVNEKITLTWTLSQ